MARRLTTISMVLLLAVVFGAGCASFNPRTADPADIDDCERLARSLVALVSDYVDEVEALPTDALLDVGNPPASLAALIDRGRALSARAPEIPCTAQDLRALMAPELQEITPEGIIAQRYLALVLQALGLEGNGSR